MFPAELPGNTSMREVNGVTLVRFTQLERQGAVAHTLLTRVGGVSTGPYASLNIGLGVGDDPAAVHENRRRAHSASGVPADHLATCHQVGGGDVAVVSAATKGQPPAADALVTRTPGLRLAMAFADCLPIIVADPEAPALGLIHAGWRGSVARVAANAWRALAALGARPERSTAYLGPAIGPCCYEIGPDVAALAREMGPQGEESLVQRDGRHYLDLPGLNARLLEGFGLRVVRSGLCTACRRDLFFSHRGDGGRTGRFAVYAGLA